MLYLLAFHGISSIYWAIYIGYLISKDEKYLSLKKESKNTLFVRNVLILYITFYHLLGFWVMCLFKMYQGKKVHQGYIRIIAEIAGVLDSVKNLKK